MNSHRIRWCEAGFNYHHAHVLHAKRFAGYSFIHPFIWLDWKLKIWRESWFHVSCCWTRVLFFYFFFSALGEKVFFSFSFFIDWFDLSRQRRQWLTNHRNMGNNMYLISKGEHLNPGVAAVLHFILTAFICAVLKVIWYKIGLSKTNVQKTQTRIRHETHMCSFTWNSLIHFFYLIYEYQQFNHCAYFTSWSLFKCDPAKLFDRWPSLQLCHVRMKLAGN